jgi:hypothetical protein
MNYKFFKPLIFLIFVLFFASISFAEAGNSFETAKLITPGTYSGENISKNNEDYYKIELNPGYRMNILITAKTQNRGNVGEINIYNEKRMELSSNGFFFNSGEAIQEMYWVASSKDESNIYFIKVGNYGAGTYDYSINVTIEDNTDIESGTDAPDTFEDALEITPGKHRGWLIAGTVGTDQIDMYKINLNKGELLTVNLTPESTASMNISIYDSTRKFQKSKLSPNEGAIIELEYPVFEETTPAYIEIKRSKDGYYDFEITVEEVDLCDYAKCTTYYECKNATCFEGECSYPNKPDGTECSTGVCKNGKCEKTTTPPKESKATCFPLWIGLFGIGMVIFGLKKH